MIRQASNSAHPLGINDQLLLASGCDKGDIAIHDMSTINTENTPGKHKRFTSTRPYN